VVKTIYGKAIVSGKVEGEALVSKTPLSYLLSVNTADGTIMEEGHELYGKSIAGKILVYPYGKGSSGDCLRLLGAVNNGVGPVGIINRDPEFVHVQGAIISNIPMVCNFDEDPLNHIKSGDHVEIDGNKIVIVKIF
jgi:predicted aconitase with swiveling domain